MKKRMFIGVPIVLSCLGLFTQVSLVHAEEPQDYQSNGSVQFIPNLEPTAPVDPENPNPEEPVQPIDPTDPTGPKPGTPGPLSIDYTSSFDFGVNRISNKDQTYFARAQTYKNGHQETPNFVQVSDNRGTNSGWRLTVTQEAQFQATTATLNQELTGAQLTLSEAMVNSNAQNVTKPLATQVVTLKPGVAMIVMSAAKDAGAGTWAAYWGTVETVTEPTPTGANQQVVITKAVALEVPGATPKDAVKYQTNLIWTLTDVPAN